MTRRRWIADEVNENRAALTGAHAAHLSRTLRAEIGQEFEVVCGDVVRHAIVTGANDNRVEFELGDEIASSQPKPITLFLAVFKFDRMEWAIEKCTELNVTSIVPLIVQRTEKHLAHAALKRVERWRRIALQASEQARRTAPPQIGVPVKLADILQVPHELRIVLAETEREAQFSDALSGRLAVQSLALAIGPEGGWTPAELQRLEHSGWVAASLGSTILRVETAAVAAVAVARYIIA